MKTALRLCFFFIFAATASAQATFSSYTAATSLTDNDNLIGYIAPGGTGTSRRFPLGTLKTYFQTGVQASNSNLTYLAGVTLTTDVRALLNSADYAAFKALLSLGNVNNTSDAAKPVSTATQTALNLKADLAALIATQAGGPNSGSGKIHWSQIEGMPSGFADGVDGGGSGGGDVVGPASSVDFELPLFSSTGGKTLKQSDIYRSEFGSGLIFGPNPASQESAWGSDASTIMHASATDDPEVFIGRTSGTVANFFSSSYAYSDTLTTSSTAIHKLETIGATNNAKTTNQALGSGKAQHYGEAKANATSTGYSYTLEANPTTGFFTISRIVSGVPTVKAKVDPSVADGASAVALLVDTVNSLSTSGAKLVSLKNAGVEKFAVDKDGNIVVGTVPGPAWSSVSGTSVALTFTAQEKVHTHTLSGNTTYTASGYAQGSRMRLFITGDGSSRTITLPSQWIAIEGALTTVAAGKVVSVEIWCTGSTESSVIYWWGAQQ
jgi:hypothetical protein